MTVPAVEVRGMEGIGPYAPGQENRFMMDVIRRWEEEADNIDTCFHVETESTVPGFPDVLILAPYGGAYDLYEFKVSDARGVVTFKKSQPLFYRKHANLRISIMVWSVPGNCAVLVKPGDVVRSKALRVKLPKVRNVDET
jgi:hypothetical protein